MAPGLPQMKNDPATFWAIQVRPEPSHQLPGRVSKIISKIIMAANAVTEVYFSCMPEGLGEMEFQELCLLHFTRITGLSIDRKLSSLLLES